MRLSNNTSSEVREAAVCIISGGLDSICTAAYLAVERGYDLYTITYSYGQRAKYEIQKARKFSKILNTIDHRVVDITFMKEIYGKTNALTDNQQHIPESFDYSIVVPIRNVIFLTIATAWAMSINAKIVAYGAHTDDIRYPDCRTDFMKSLTDTLNLAEADGISTGLRHKITVWSPAIDGINKSELMKIGYKILGDKIFKSWSCYSNGIIGENGSILHCGKCESCINRKIAINKAGIEDKTYYATNG